MSCCYISDFQIARPNHERDQESILEWIAKAHSYSAKETPEIASSFLNNLKQVGLGAGKIQNRGIQFSDMLSEEWGSMSIFNLDKAPHGLGLKERMTFFDREVSALFERFYPEGSFIPEHLIHVSCTGYAAPSGAQKLVSLRKATNTQVTHAYHMACYASLPAIRMGHGFLAASKDDLSVDVVHTELCTIHMNPSLHTKEQTVIESLFADGFMKYSLKKNQNGPSFKTIAFQEEIIPNSVQDMSWTCQDWGFFMQVAKEVPFKIAKHIFPFLERISKKAELSLEDLLKKAVFAIHPGGPKIIDQTTKLLKLADWQAEHSFEVLKSYGNMSSATLPHIWQKILNDPSIPEGCFIISLGFGPGLTLSGALFQKQGTL